MLPAEITSHRTDFGDFFSDFFGVVYLTGEQKPPLRIQTRLWCLPLPLGTPNTLLSFGAADTAASPGMGLSSHCAASQRRLPGSLPLYTAPPLSLASSLRLSSICSRSFHPSHAHFLLPTPPPRQRSTGRRSSFQPHNTQL